MKAKCLKFILFFLFTYQFLGFPGISQAWFEVPVSAEQPFWNKNTSTPKQPETKTLFIYDNLLNKDQLSNPYLTPPNKFFIPAYSVNIDMPLITLSQRSGSSLESIDALLYANLKLELLFQDYNLLRKRTDKLFKSLNIPYIEQLKKKKIQNLNIVFDGNTNIVNEQLIKIQEDPQNLSHQETIKSVGASEDNSIDQGTIRRQRDILAYKMTEVARNNSTGHFFLPEKNIPSFTGLDQQSKGLTPRGENVFTLTATSYKTALTSKGPDVQNGLNLENTSEHPESYSEYDSIGNSVPSNNEKESGQLPWIFRVILNTINFVIYNKIEAMFYGAVLFFIIFFISLKARA